MCYTGTCPYEDHTGECKFNGHPHGGEWIIKKQNPQCMQPDNANFIAERKQDMKVLNKNNKIKYSKMLIDYDAYAKICENAGTTLNEHLRRLEKGQSNKDFVPEMMDVQIMFEVYSKITKVVHKRRDKCHKMKKSRLLQDTMKA